MTQDKCWIPNLYPCPDFNQWAQYEDKLYAIYKKDLEDSILLFQNLPVHLKSRPEEDNKPGAFWHLTCRDYLHNNNRQPDLNRCERICWIKSFIENYNLCHSSNCHLNCDGVKVWEQPFNGGPKIRVHILLSEERYLIILEKRRNYYLLITAFYIDSDHRLQTELSDYHKYSTP